MLPLQVCKGFVPKLPCIVGGVHIQYHQAAAGGDSDIVCTASAPPLRNLRGVCGSILASVRGGRFLAIAGKYPQAHWRGVVLCVFQRGISAQVYHSPPFSFFSSFGMLIMYVVPDLMCGTVPSLQPFRK